MSVKNAITSNRYLLIYFSLLILIPGTLLALLAFRGIRNDQALIEKRSRQELEKANEEVVQSLRHIIDSVKTRTYDMLLSGIPLDSFYSSSFVVNILEYRTNRQKWLLPTHDSNIKKLSGRPAIFPEGNRLEYEDKNYEKAIEYYRSKLLTSDEPNSKAQMYISLNRLYKKTGNYYASKKVCSQLYDQYPDILIIKTIPAGWIAKNEIIDQLITTMSFDEAVDHAILLFNDLISDRWTLDWNDYSYMLDNTFDLVSLLIDSVNSSGSLDSLKRTFHLIQKQDSVGKYLHNFRTGISDIASFEKSRLFVETVRQRYFYDRIKVGDTQYFVVYDLGQIQILTERLFIGHSVINAVTVSYPDDISDPGKSVKEGALTLNAILPDDLPPWRISLTGQDVLLWSGLFDLSNGVYLYIFIFIIILLIFGLYFVLKTINTELHLSNLKSDFVASVSHEFKSPITAIRQLSERLTENKVPTEERKKEYYEVLHAQSIRLSHLVDNILDFAKLESGEKQFSFRPENLNQLIRDTANRFTRSAIHVDFPVQLELADPLPEVMMDRSAITQVLENLLDNAIKYAPSENGVIIRTGQNNNRVLFSVRDFGEGIEKEYRDKIFDRFYRINNEETIKAKGSGIGLSLVHKIIEGHGGTITVESKLGEGTSFIITFFTNQ